MTNSEWVPVEVMNKSVLSARNGMVEIEWRLSESANSDWVSVFTPQGTKKGTGAFVLSPSEPIAYSRLIRWEIPEEDVEAANEYVTSSVTVTNNAYRRLLDKRRHEREKLEQNLRVEEENKAAIQRKLDDLT